VHLELEYLVHLELEYLELKDLLKCCLEVQGLVFPIPKGFCTSTVKNKVLSYPRSSHQWFACICPD